MTKVVIYARVSSKEQEKEGYSIPAQLELLRKYALKNNYTVVKEFEDVETAKSSGRTYFNEMIKMMKNSKDTITILVEKTDRLYRNLPDYVLLDSMHLDLHFVKEGVVLNDNSHSSEKFMHLIKVGMAKQYVDNLAEEVKKGLLQKAKEGYVMGKQPYGYNKINPKESVINETTSQFVIRAFEIYSEGDISLSKLVTQLYAEGFTYKLTQPKIQKSQLEHILKNPFYYGMIQFKNELYNGKHEPIITKELFDLAQVAFKKDNKPKYQMPKSFMFANILKCSNCGCQISGEIKKGKYIYYSCSGGKGECEQKHVYIREEDIEKQFIEALERISLSEEQKEWMIKALIESFKDEQLYTKERIDSFNEQKENLRRRIDNIYLDKLDGKISEVFWKTKHNEWTNELNNIQNKINAHENSNINFIEHGSKILKFCTQVKSEYLNANNIEKKEILKTVLQNSYLKGKELSYTYHSPYNLLANSVCCTIKYPGLDSNQ